MMKTNPKIGILSKLIIAVSFGVLPSGFSLSQQKQDAKRITNIVEKQTLSVQINDVWGKNGIFEGYRKQDEVIGKRTKSAKHFRNTDGSYTAQVGGNYHFKDESGQWKDIDLRIEQGNTGIEGYSYKNVTNDVKSFFPQNAATNGVLMKLEGGTDFVWWKTPGFKITSGGTAIKVYEPSAVSGQVSGNTLTYPNIYNKISEEFVVLNGGIENNIILHERTSEIASLPSGSMLEFNQFIPFQKGWEIVDSEGKSMRSDFETDHFSIRFGNENNNIYFGKIVVFDNHISKEDAMLVHVPSEKLTDLQKQKLHQSVYTIRYKVKFVNGGVEIVSTLPASWLNASDRTFPVVIDPTVTITPVTSEGYFYGPMTHWYGFQRHASLYLQSEIGTYGMITEIEYNCTDAGTGGSKPTKVYMRTNSGGTLLPEMWNSTNYTSGSQLCLNGNTDQGNTSGWKSLPLTTPFLYDQDNLLIMVYDAWGGSGSAKYYNQSTAITSRQAYSRNDNSDPGDDVSLTVENRLSEIRITYVPQEECDGMPDAGVVSASATEVCVNVELVLTSDQPTLFSGIEYQWQSSTDGEVTWNNLGSPQMTSVYVLPSQSEATSYRLIATCTLTNDSDTSSSVTVGQTPWENCYCINSIPLNCTDGDVITNVTIESINNNSGCGSTTNGYSDYTTTVAPAQLEAGTTVPVSVTVGPSGGGWLYESVGIWIDYNQNGVLDSLEGEYTNIGTGLNQALNGSITIPSTALPGLTRMRVVGMASVGMQNAFVCGPVDPDENFGEIEDYTVNIIVPQIPVDSVVVTTQGGVPAEISILSGTLQLEATVYPLSVDQNVTWNVIPVTGAASISAAGLVTAQADGTVWAKAVSVEDVTKADSILITITNQTVVSVDSVVVTTQSGVPAEISIPSGTLQLEAAVYPLSMDQAVTWSIIPVTGTASISTAGLVTAQANGTVWTKAVSVEDVTKADSILITITNQDLSIENVDLTDLSIFPNPTADLLTLKSDEKHTALELIVTDLTGKTLFADKLKNNELNKVYTIDLSHCSPGIYIIRLVGSDINVQRQIVKQ